MKFEKVIQYRAGDVVVEFRKAENVIGSSHRVLIVKNGNLVAKDWLSDTHQPAEKHAAFYCEKHASKIA